jgi:hypothetical protein
VTGGGMMQTRTLGRSNLEVLLNPPDRGIRGNSHMIMQDNNNLQIADLILQWIDERVGKRDGGKK